MKLLFVLLFLVSCASNETKPVEENDRFDHFTERLFR